MSLHLSDHFTLGRLLRFTLPSMAMMVFTSVYVIVDGFFVSNCVGKIAFAGMTLIFPLLGILGALGFLFGAGGSAIVGKFLGQKRKERAGQSFSFFIYLTLISGTMLALLGEVILAPVADFLGAKGEVREAALLYGRITLLSLPGFMLQFCFQPFFVTAEKAGLGFWCTVIAGVANMVLDVLFIPVLGLGLFGAALATAISEYLGGLLPLCYFGRANTSLLRLGRAHWSFPLLRKAVSNGSSEFLNNVSFPILIALYSYRLLALAGENGVAAFGVVLYVSYIFSALFLGYAIGSAPLVSFNFGARNYAELANIFKKSLVINVLAGFCLTLLSFVAAHALAALFTGYDETLCAMTSRALIFFSPVFLFAGINIYGSSFFTALNNGMVSAVISVLRSLVFGVLSILLLPLFFGLDGVWYAYPVGECATACVTAFLLFALRRAHRYG